jgi:hypothetical protein
MEQKSSIIDLIRALEPSEAHCFRGKSPESIRAIVSRVRVEFRRKRRYHTETVNGGVRVWRLQ